MNLDNLICSALLVLNLGAGLVGDFDPYEERQHHETIDLFPAVGELYIDGFAGCSAVLIDEEWALTAAHCLDDASVFDIRFGPEFRTVTYHVSSDQYGLFNGDIALLQFDAVVGIDPIPLSERTPGLSDLGRFITFVGYSQGFESFNKPASSAYLTNLEGTDILLFVGAHIWPGDSGGATLWYESGEYRLIGINVLFWHKDDRVFASGSTRIDKHYEWIIETMSLQGRVQELPVAGVDEGSEPTGADSPSVQHCP